MEIKRLYSIVLSFNRTGGLLRLASAKAILGFVRFTQYYYLVIVTETKPEGIIMGHIIYSILVRFLLSSYD